MSFPTAVGFSFAFLAALIFPLRLVRVDSWSGLWASRRALGATLPFFGLTALMVGVGLYGQFVRKSYWGDPLTLEELPMWLRVMGAFYYLFYYSWRSFYPVKHHLLTEDLVGVEPTDPRLIAAVVFVAGALVWCLVRRRSHPAGLAFAVAFIGILGPVLNFTGGTPYPGDRYALLTGLLQSVAIGCLILALKSGRRRRAAVIGLTVFSVIVAVPSRQRSHVWKDDVSYFSDQASNLHDELYLSQAHRQLGARLIEEDRIAAGLEHWDRAWDFSAKHSLDVIGDEYPEHLLATGRFSRAAAVLEQMARMKPGEVVMSMRQSYVWLRLGERGKAETAVNEMMTGGQYARAPIADYMFELPSTRELSTLMEMVADAHLRRGEVMEATTVFEIQIEAFRDSAAPYSRFAQALLDASHPKEAAEIVRKGRERFPEDERLRALQKAAR